MDTPGVMLPKAVRYMVTAVREAGLEPGVRQRRGGQWEVVVEGEHVRASAIFGVKPGSVKARPLRGELLIDGVPRPRATSMAELQDIWDEHELGIRDHGLLQVTDPGSEAVPGPVQFAADTMRTRSGGQLAARCGRARRRWAVAVDFGPGTGLRLVFEWHEAYREWRVSDRNPIQIFVDGEDRSSEAQGQIDRAVALLAAPGYPEGVAPAPGLAASPSARDNGVETRRLVVKRVLGRPGPSLAGRPGAAVPPPGGLRPSPAGARLAPGLPAGKAHAGRGAAEAGSVRSALSKA